VLCDPRASANLRFGTTPIDVAPALWGGFSEYLYLPSRSILHRVPDGVPAATAALALPLGNGYQWAKIDGGAGPGSAVLVQGPGQQGLGCAIAALEAGAHLVIVAGTGRDAARLEVAGALGAVPVDVTGADLVARVMELTNGAGVDVAIDASGGRPETVHAAVDSLRRKEGVAVLQPAPVPDFPLDLINRKAVTVRMTRGHSYAAVEWGLALMAARRSPLELLSTHTFGVHEVDRAIRTAGGEDGAQSIHVTVLPWDDERAAAGTPGEQAP
jgi:threonine dehydrogenase-like Zn-dependent dehydrogenase